MTRTKWYEGGEYAPTVAATALSLLAAPIGGLGVIFLFFGAWVPALGFLLAGTIMWFTGRRLIDR